jgi:tetratricopeptide (TPR) repeat protein
MPRKAKIALVAFALWLNSAGWSDEVSVFHAKGDSRYRNFDNFGALAEYRRAYDLAPTDFETLIRMVRIHNDIGRSMLRSNDSAEVWYLKSVEYAQRLVDLYPDSSESYFWMAVTHGSLVPFKGVSEKLDIGKAVTRYARKSIELDSTFGPAYMVLGIVYREGARLKWYERLIANTIFGGSLPGTLEESERMLLRSIELHPNNFFAYHELSRTYGQMGNEEKRKECLEKISTLTPRSLREKEEQQRAGRQLERMLAPPQQ